MIAVPFCPFVPSWRQSPVRSSQVHSQPVVFEAGRVTNKPCRNGMLLARYLTAREKSVTAKEVPMLSALIRRSLKCSNLLDSVLRRIRPSRGFVRVDVRRKLMTFSSANNRLLVTRILNPNGNYVTLSSEIVTFLKSSEKARIAEAISRDWCYPSRRVSENKPKPSTSYPTIVPFSLNDSFAIAPTGIWWLPVG